jgi:hypothetical protein
MYFYKKYSEISVPNESKNEKKSLDTKYSQMFRITGFLDFVHSPELYITKKDNVSGTGSLSVTS